MQTTTKITTESDRQDTFPSMNVHFKPVQTLSFHNNEADKIEWIISNIIQEMDVRNFHNFKAQMNQLV